MSAPDYRKGARFAAEAHMCCGCGRMRTDRFAMQDHLRDSCPDAEAMGRRIEVVTLPHKSGHGLDALPAVTKIVSTVQGTNTNCQAEIDIHEPFVFPIETAEEQDVLYGLLADRLTLWGAFQSEDSLDIILELLLLYHDTCNILAGKKAAAEPAKAV